MSAILDTHHRALAVNLDPTSYGTFAEIGAGQEVARWFLSVGAAAGTVAKTISAYDMAVSDSIYGQAGRYVSRERLLAMLDHEYSLLLQRLRRTRGSKSRFFVFADTVSARNFAGTNECHGWVGLRFQTEPGSRPSDVLLHVNLRDPTSREQQDALGILGVNLLHAAFFELGRGARLLDALLAGLSVARLEIDYVELAGPAFERVDRRALGVDVVRRGLALAVLVTRTGALVPPTEFLRKHPIVIERRRAAGRGGAPSRRLQAAASRLAVENPGFERPPLALFEVSTAAAAHRPAPAALRVRQRVAQLARPSAPVLLTRLATAYELVRYLRRYTRQPIVLALTPSDLVEALSATNDRARTGQAFEAFGRLLGEDARMFVGPEPVADFRAALRRAGLDPRSVRCPQRGPLRVEDLGLSAPLDALLDYLLGAGWVVPLGGRPARLGR